MGASIGAENRWHPHVIAGTITAPLTSSRSRAWNSIVVETYRGFREHLVAEYPYHLITLQLRGSREIFQRRDNRALRQTTRAGTVIVTPMGSAKEWRNGAQHDCEFVVLNLSPDRLAGVMAEGSLSGDRQVELLDNFGTRDPVIENIVLRLLEESRSEDVAQAMYVEALTDQLCIHLLRRYSTLKAATAAPRGSLPARKLQRAIEFIDANLHGDLTIEAVAKALCMSPSHFARSFRQSTGIAPHQYVLERRIAMAKQLLRNSGRPIARVAQQVGFSTSSHFSGTFARIVGRTPRQYRQEG